jgi:hypothetical protein
MNPMNVGWVGDWAWSLPLILLTVVIHVFGLALIGERVVDVLSVSEGGRNLTPRFAAVMGATAREAHGSIRIQEGEPHSSPAVFNRF